MHKGGTTFSSVGRRTLTRAIAFQGNTQKDWSADDKVFSRSLWPGAVAAGSNFPRRLFSGGSLQGTDSDLWARRLPEKSSTPAGGSAGGLPHQQKRAHVLPPARLPADPRASATTGPHRSERLSIAGFFAATASSRISPSSPLRPIGRPARFRARIPPR
jgi:hypothetical protein